MKKYEALITYQPVLDGKKVAWHWQADIIITDENDPNHTTVKRVVGEHGFWDKDDCSFYAKQAIDKYVEAMKMAQPEFYVPSQDGSQTS